MNQKMLDALQQRLEKHEANLDKLYEMLLARIDRLEGELAQLTYFASRVEGVALDSKAQLQEAQAQNKSLESRLAIIEKVLDERGHILGITPEQYEKQVLEKRHVELGYITIERNPFKLAKQEKEKDGRD